MPIAYLGAGVEGTGAAGASPAVGYPAPGGGIPAGAFLWLPCGASVATVFATSAAGAGWTRRYTATSGGSAPSGAGFYRFAAGGESGTISLTSPGGSSVGRMFAYSGVDPTTPFDVADAVWAGSSVAVTAWPVPAQTVVTAGAVGIVHVFGNTTTGGWTPPTNYTELWDIASSPTTEVAHRLSLATGDTGVRSAAHASVRGGGAGVILRPAPATVEFSGWGIPM